MLMMMMMMRKGGKSLALLALVLASAHCLVPPSQQDLNEISVRGEKYLDQQIENAINGVKEMKDIMQKSSHDHQKFLDVLEKTKQQKEEALRSAQDMEAKMEEEEEVCNDTMKALWEQCKPCLKNTCVKYYSRVCSSGSGLVGRQLEQVMNHTSPFSIFINGQTIGELMQEGRRQNSEFRSLEDKYSKMEDGVESLFADSMKVADHAHFNPPPFYMPSFLSTYVRPIRSIRSLFRNPFHSFQDMFSPMMEQNFFSSMDMDSTDANEEGNKDMVLIKPFGNDKMTCREIRRSSAGCFKLRDECQKCKAIEDVDCSGRKLVESPVKKDLEEALATVDRYTQQYESMLRKFEEQMLNTSSIMEWFNKQFSWVSSLTDLAHDGIFRVQTVTCGDQEDEPGEEKQPSDTKVSVKLFDGPTMNLTVPGDIPWNDPKFSEVVAQEALNRYKESSVVVK